MAVRNGVKSREYPDGDGKRKRSGVDRHKDEPGGGAEWAIRFVLTPPKKPIQISSIWGSFDPILSNNCLFFSNFLFQL